MPWARAMSPSALAMKAASPSASSIQASRSVGRHLLRCSEMLGNVVGSGRGFHQVSSVRLAANKRASSISLACELCQATSKTEPLPTPKTEPPLSRSGASLSESFRLGCAGCGVCACSWFLWLVALNRQCRWGLSVFSPQASSAGVGGLAPPMPAEEAPPACGRNSPDLRFSLSR